MDLFIETETRKKSVKRSYVRPIKTVIMEMIGNGIKKKNFLCITRRV